MKMKLKLVAVAVAALVPVVALLAYNEFAVRHQRNEEVRAAAAQAARQASSEVERIIEGLHSLLIAVSSMPSVQNLDASACSEAFSSVASKVGNIRTIFVVDPRGQSVCGSMKTAGQNFSDRNYYRPISLPASPLYVRFGSTRLRLDGPDVALVPELALPLSLVIHELATNATKYGSLSQDAGHVSIVWAHEANRVRLVWQETGGPLVEHPTTKGFGSVLIERAFPATADATCTADYRPKGLVFELAFSTATVVQS